MTFSTGQCLRPVLNGPPRVTSKKKAPIIQSHVRHRWNSKTDSREVGGRGFKPWVCACGAPFIFYKKQIISTGEAVPVGKLVLNGVSQLVLKSPFLIVRRMEIIYAHNQWIKKVLLSNYFLAFYFESHMLEWYGGQRVFSSDLLLATILVGMYMLKLWIYCSTGVWWNACCA